MNDISTLRLLYIFFLFIQGILCQSQVSTSNNDFHINWNKFGRLKPLMGSYEEFIEFNPDWDKKLVKNFTFDYPNPNDSISIKIGFMDINDNGNYFDYGVDRICIILSRDILFPPFYGCLSACNFKDTVHIRINRSDFTFLFKDVANNYFTFIKDDINEHEFDICLTKYLDLSIKLCYESDSSTSNAYYQKMSIEDILKLHPKEKYVYFFYWAIKTGPDEIPRLIELSQKGVLIISIFNDINGNITKNNMEEIGIPGFIARPTRRAVYELDFTECSSGLLMTRDGVIIQRNIQPDIVKNYLH